MDDWKVYVNKAKGENTTFPKLLLEQRARLRDYQPETVSSWDTTEWALIQEEFALEEVSLNQGDHGGSAVKPTTFGGDLRLVVPSPWPGGRSEDRATVTDSKLLAR